MAYQIKDYKLDDVLEESLMAGIGGTYPERMTTANNEDARYPHGIIFPGETTNRGLPVLPPMAILTVSDYERLAKAGVKVEYADIKHSVVPDPVQKHSVVRIDTELADLIVHRWNRIDERAMNGMEFPFLLSAVRHEDKIYVFVAPRPPHGRKSHGPVILEDDGKLYPSDALIAKLSLLLETQKGL